MRAKKKFIIYKMQHYKYMYLYLLRSAILKSFGCIDEKTKSMPYRGQNPKY